MKKITLLALLFISLASFAQDAPCTWTDGYYHYYVALITDELPDATFDKTDFINHINTNSTVAADDLSFLNSSVITVEQAFPSSQNATLQKTVAIVANSDAMESFLLEYTAAIEDVEYYCEAQLSNETFKEALVTVYPNPTTELLYINLESNDYTSLAIVDTMGKLVYEQPITSNELITINLATFTKGMYFLQLKAANHTLTKKILKNE